MKFQLLDISSDDLEIKDNEKKFIITLYGKTDEEINDTGFYKNIVCHIHGFKPFFYIKVPNEWPQSYINSTFVNKDGINIRHHILTGDIHMDKEKPVLSREFYGYHHN